jgi:hypothetical protein
LSATDALAIVTLEDAAKYIQKLPKAEQQWAATKKILATTIFNATDD